MKPKNVLLVVVFLGLGVAALWWFTRPAADVSAARKITEAPSAPKSVLVQSAPKPPQVEAPKVAPANPNAIALSNAGGEAFKLIDPAHYSAELASRINTYVQGLSSKNGEPSSGFYTATHDAQTNTWRDDPLPGLVEILINNTIRPEDMPAGADPRAIMSGKVVYLPSANRFYIRWLSWGDEPFPNTFGPAKVYGPFDGDPYALFGIAHPAVAATPEN